MRYLYSPFAAAALVVAYLAGALVPANAKAVEIIVIQKDKKFVPNEIEARVGDTLTFVNDEKRKRHNVFSSSPGFEYLDIRKQKPGDRDSVTLKNAGTAIIQCALHPKMKVTIVILN